MHEFEEYDRRTAYDERNELQKKWVKLPKITWDIIEDLRETHGITRPMLIQLGIQEARLSISFNLGKFTLGMLSAAQILYDKEGCKAACDEILSAIEAEKIKLFQVLDVHKEMVKDYQKRVKEK